jgi:hypothetical protein
MTALLFEAPTPRSSRDRILEYLGSHGGRVTSSDGCNLTATMAEGAGYASIAALNAMLSRMERDGLIEREVRGKRTYGVALTKAGRSGSGPAPAPRIRRAARKSEPTTAWGPSVNVAELFFALSSIIVGMQTQNDELARRVTVLEETVKPAAKRTRNRAA